MKGYIYGFYKEVVYEGDILGRLELGRLELGTLWALGPRVEVF
jgi:hypothetical protein